MEEIKDTRTEEEIRIDQEQIDKVYAELAAYDKEVREHNEKLISEIGVTAAEDFKDLTDDIHVHEKMEIVDKPSGTNNDESFGVFTEVFVDQWSVGMEWDSFEGFLYARFAEDKWLKIRYSC